MWFAQYCREATIEKLIFSLIYTYPAVKITNVYIADRDAETEERETRPERRRMVSFRINNN